MSLEKYLTLRNEISLKEVSFGYSTLTLIGAAELEEAQLGYRYDDMANDITGIASGDWQPGWFVIAKEDYLGDPIFIDSAESGFPVYTAMHGAGEWEAERIADSFSGFLKALETVSSFSKGREHPVGLEENPLSETEKEELLQKIERYNPDSVMGFWEDWVDISEE